jgi:1-acyl-sn-glycerol-3-phosphate acyltransferase
MQFLGSLLFTAYLFASTAVFSVAVVLSGIFPYPVRHAVASGWARTNMWVLNACCRLDYRVEGAENIPPGNHISMWKHSSSWETLSQMIIFPPQAWVLKHELMWIPILGWAIKMMRPIAIDRGSGHVAVNQVLEQGKQRLEAGLWILVFPEGTRTAPGTTRKYGISGALLAKQTGRFVVPVAHNAGYYWPRRGLVKKPGTIRVVIGPPIDPRHLEPRELNERIQSWIEATVAELAPD